MKKKVLKRKIEGSWAIREVAYDKTTGILTVSMQYGTQGQGKMLRYGDVPEYVYQELINAESKGRYFNANIRNVFNFLGES